MFVLGILIFIAILVTKILISTDLIYFIDVTTLLMIIGFNISILIVTGSLQDFKIALINIFKNDEKSSPNEIKRSIIVFDLLIKVTIISGFIGAIIDFISMMHTLSDLTTIGSYVSLIVLSFFYSLSILCFLLLPAKFILKKKI